MEKTQNKQNALTILNFPIKKSLLRTNLIKLAAREHLVQKLIMDNKSLVDQSLLPKILSGIPKLFI